MLLSALYISKKQSSDFFNPRAELSLAATKVLANPPSQKPHAKALTIHNDSIFNKKLFIQKQNYETVEVYEGSTKLAKAGDVFIFSPVKKFASTEIQNFPNSITIFAGVPLDDLTQICKEKNIKFINYLSYEPFSIKNANLTSEGILAKILMYYKRKDIRMAYDLRYGDCFKLLDDIPDKSVDLILTDPPYNIAKYSTGNIDLPGRSALNNDLADWDKTEIEPRELLANFKRIIKPKGNIFIFTTYNRSWIFLYVYK